MPIRRLTPPAEIDRYIAGRTEAIKKALVYNLCAIGEQVLNAARLSNSYKDQTGNLRSSIGYVVAVDGEIVQMSSFDVVKNGGRGSKGGKTYAMCQQRVTTSSTVRNCSPTNSSHRCCNNLDLSNRYTEWQRQANRYKVIFTAFSKAAPFIR